MPPIITEQDLVAACRETLRLWPQVRAAVLFGSRARGTAHTDSDWDVAIVLEGSHPNRPSPARSIFPQSDLPADLPHVDLWALSEEDLHRNARALGTLHYVVCRDGRVLAGEWNTPDPTQMQDEGAVNPEDWALRMNLALIKLDTAITQIKKIAASRTWADSAANSIMLLQNSANAAELLVKATMERRSVPADRSHDITELAAAFSTQRPDDTALAKRMAALNSTIRSHHIAMYEFRPPEGPDVSAAIRRLAGTLDLWASEVETTGGDMTAHLARLAQSGVDHAGRWPDLVRAPVNPKMDEDQAAQASVEAVLEGRADLIEAIALFLERTRHVLNGPGPS